jgi:hypothetical protein
LASAWKWAQCGIYTSDTADVNFNHGLRRQFERAHRIDRTVLCLFLAVTLSHARVRVIHVKDGEPLPTFTPEMAEEDDILLMIRHAIRRCNGRTYHRKERCLIIRPPATWTHIRPIAFTFVKLARGHSATPSIPLSGHIADADGDADMAED